MIETKGVKHEKVKAAFEYAEIFVKESAKYGEINDVPEVTTERTWFGRK